MRLLGRWCVAGLVGLGFLVSGLRVDARGLQAVSQTPTIASDETEPQAVRVRYVEGDVRVARDGESSEWEQVVADLPMETGFNLVTGDGRAEIEFEDASTVYLDANSALAFADIHTTGGVPHTEISLLAGTATLHLQPAYADETFVVKTPTDRITTTFPTRRYVRVTSYLDAIAMTTLVEPAFRTNKAASAKAAVMPTVFHNNGKIVPPDGAYDPGEFAAWDTWVATRLALRSAAVAAVTKASGLPDSTPGLADLNGQGVFFDCAPYGTCWEPPPDQANDVSVSLTEGPDFEMVAGPSAVTIHAGDEAPTTISAVGMSGFTYPIDVVAALPNGIACKTVCEGQIAPGEELPIKFVAAPNLAAGTYTVMFTASSGPLSHKFAFTIYVVDEDEADFVPFEPAEPPAFACFPTGVRPVRVGYHGHLGGVGIRSYGWAVCHTGTWIFRRGMYVWVLPPRPPHRPLPPGKPRPPRPPRPPHHPCHWIKVGKRTFYVPWHPKDRPDRTPINGKHEVYEPEKGGESVERTTLAPGSEIERLDEAPKEFQRPAPVRLTRVDAPKIPIRSVKEPVGKEGGAYLSLDEKSHSLVMTKEVVEGGKRRTVTETFDEHRMNVVQNHAVAGATAHGAPAAHTGAAPTHTAAPAHTGGGGHPASSSHTSGASHSSPPPASHTSTSPAHH